MPYCPYCRELHPVDRVMTFDGFGVNGCDLYRSRVATLEKDARQGSLGYEMAAAPELKTGLKLLLMAATTIKADYDNPNLFTAEQVKVAYHTFEATMKIAKKALDQATPWVCPGCHQAQTGHDKGICDPCKAYETVDPNHGH